jgi:hypothetical protein
MISNDSPTSASNTNKVIPILEKNFNKNLASTYTEIIENLDRNFDYNSNSNHYWSEPKFSLLYNTPLYEQASETQKLALNHLYWILRYKFTADSEIETSYYNTITADCLKDADSDYAMLVDLLALETAQESKHIHAFYQVNYQTIKSLLGKKALLNNSVSQDQKNVPAENSVSSLAENLIKNINLNTQKKDNSQQLGTLKDISQTPLRYTNGFFNGIAGQIAQLNPQFFNTQWGTNPFLAASFYGVRYMANLLLKSTEHSIYNYCRHLQKNNAFVPAPTAISYYHFLDESFHTTTSLFIGRDFYKNLPKPTYDEKVIANLAILRTQSENFSSISGILPNRFLSDGYMIGFLMKVFQSPVFRMSEIEAKQWVEKCLCYEHEGFHSNLKHHNHLLTELRYFAEDVEYLLPINREMQVMASGASVNKAIKNNIADFKRFFEAAA